MKHPKIMFAIAVVLMLACTASGWIYSALNSRQQISNSLLHELNQSFIQSYGTNITINKLVSPDRVFAALCEDESGNTFVSWNIGGLWVTVWDGE
jgi:hypothetical protein